MIVDYDSQVSYGQRRVLRAWSRLSLPVVRSMSFNRQPAGAAAGYACLEDRVNQHWGGIARAAALSTLLSIGAEMGSDSDNDIARAMCAGGKNTINQDWQEIVRRQLNIQPTLIIIHSYPVRGLWLRVIGTCQWRTETRRNTNKDKK